MDDDGEDGDRLDDDGLVRRIESHRMMVDRPHDRLGRSNRGRLSHRSMDDNLREQQVAEMDRWVELRKGTDRGMSDDGSRRSG